MYPALKAAVDQGVFLSTPDCSEAAKLFRGYGQVLDEEREQFTKYWATDYNSSSWPKFEEARETFEAKLVAVSLVGKNRVKRRPERPPSRKWNRARMICYSIGRRGGGPRIPRECAGSHLIS
jgi:hypothetical protein